MGQVLVSTARTSLSPGRGRDQKGKRQVDWAASKQASQLVRGRGWVVSWTPQPTLKSSTSLPPHHFQCRRASSKVPDRDGFIQNPSV